eukprot:Opistho-2@39756
MDLNAAVFMGRLGSIHWLAPEIIAGDRFVEAADVYSYGIVTWEVATGEELYVGVHPMAVGFRVLNEDMRPSVEDITNEPLKALMTSCWAKEVADRPSFPSIVERLRLLPRTSLTVQLPPPHSLRLPSPSASPGSNRGGGGQSPVLTPR